MYRRNSNTTVRGGAFDNATIVSVWRKAQIVAGNDPAVIRKDCCGAWIRFRDYGTTGDKGWEIDHIKPVSMGGGDEQANLQPLQWRNNRHKGDSYPHWSCAMVAAA